MHISPSTCWGAGEDLKNHVGVSGGRGWHGGKWQNRYSNPVLPEFSPSAPLCGERFVPSDEPRAPSPSSPLDDGGRYTGKSRSVLVPEVAAPCRECGQPVQEAGLRSVSR